MVGVVVAAHGEMARALVGAANSIIGEQAALLAVDLLPHEDLEAGREKLRAAIAQVDDGSGVVVLADLFGGTPSNCCLSLLEESRLEVVAGVNLPMLLRVTAIRSQVESAEELARDLVAYGRKNIESVSQLLREVGARMRK